MYHARLTIRDFFINEMYGSIEDTELHMTVENINSDNIRKLVLNKSYGRFGRIA